MRTIIKIILGFVICVVIPWATALAILHSAGGCVHNPACIEQGLR